MTTSVKPSVRQVSKTRRYVISIVFWILVVHLVAVAQFTSGFLLTRPVIDRESQIAPIKSTFERAVVLVVDALRYDFVVTPPDAPETPFTGHFPWESISSDPRHSFALKFVADPPTTTLQRLKGLTTGSLPAFVDAGSNFAGFKIEEDNWVSQARKRLGSVAFVGDDTWEALYSHEMSELYPYPSLNVRDLDTVDNGVKAHMPGMVRNASNKIVIGHTLGVDHVGHRFGPAHPAMSQKLDETFAFVRELAQEIDDKTVLFVFGDHGMDFTGNHGGDSSDEVDAALWVYSKKPAFNAEGPQTVNQIDLVPTLSALLGLPIPFNSLGTPIPQAFSARDLRELVEFNDARIREYAQVVGMRIGDQMTQSEMLNVFKEAWAQFDLSSMAWGLGTLLASVLASLLLYSSISLPVLSLVCRGQLLGALGGTLLGLLAKVPELRVSPVKYAIASSRYTGAGILILGSWPLLRHPRMSLPSVWSLLALVLLGLEGAANFSNSFVIWESKVLQFFIATCVVVLVISATRRGSPLVTYLGLWYSVALLLLTRLSSSWVLCREETAQRCATTFFEANSSLWPTWTLFALGAVGLLAPYVYVRFWTIGQNNVGIANLVLNITPLAIALSAAYWSLDNAEARGWLGHELWGLQNGKVLISRTALLLGVGLGLLVWWRGSLPIEIILSSKTGAPEKIAGYNNIFGSYSALAVVCIFWSLLVTQKPPAGLALAALLYSCLSALDLLDVTETKHTLLAPFMFDMLANGYFYFTGHQATIPSIQWDSAFIAARTVTFPWSAICVVFNTFGPFVLCPLVAVICPLWRRPPFKDPVQPLVFFVRAVAGLTLVTGARAAASFAAAFLLRRHLMTWKIFAPRFMFGAMVLIVCDLALLCGAALNGHTIKKVAEIFG